MRAAFWGLVGVGVAVGVAGGLGVLARTEPVYASSTSVLVQPLDGEPNLQTEAQLVRSTKTAADAQARMPDGAPLGLPTVDALPGTSVLVIRFEANAPARAQAGARAFAAAYLANRAETAKGVINDQLTALMRRSSEVNDQLGEVNALIARLPTNSPDLTTLRSTLSSLTTQVATMTARINELQTTQVDPGRVIRDADLPGAPVRPDRLRYLVIAAGIGGLVAAGAALARERWSRRVRHGLDLARHNGITLLAQLAPDAVAIGTGMRHPGARAFNRLRNEVVASLGPGDRTVLVSGACPGPSPTLVAANLAAALARADNEVILVSATVPELGCETLTAAQLFDVADVPGLTDVLAGRTSLARAIQHAARSPRLRVVTPGGTASATGLLQSEGVRGVIAALARQARFVVIEAPSTASGADAQSLASFADAAVLVVEAGRARHDQVADAMTQLLRVGTRLLGAVVVPKLKPGDVASANPAGHRAPPPEYETEDWITNSTTAIEAPTRKFKTLSPPPTPSPASPAP